MAKTGRRQRKVLPVYPTYAEVHAIINACENERDRMLVELLWHTGGRVSEVIMARVGDITPHGIKLLNLKQTKSAQKHVFLGADFVARLHAYCAGKSLSDYIITRLNGHERITRERAWQIVTGAGYRASVIKRKPDGQLHAPWPHSLRHANAIRLLESGVPVSAVQGQLGHNDLGSTSIYLQLTDPHRQQMIQAVKF